MTSQPFEYIIFKTEKWPHNPQKSKYIYISVSIAARQHPEPSQQEHKIIEYLSIILQQRAMYRFEPNALSMTYFYIVPNVKVVPPGSSNCDLVGPRADINCSN